MERREEWLRDARHAAQVLPDGGGRGTNMRLVVALEEVGRLEQRVAEEARAWSAVQARFEKAEARAVKAEQERDDLRARVKEMDDDLTLLNALQDAEEDRDAAERELADLRARIEALADEWEQVALRTKVSRAELERDSQRLDGAAALRAALSPTDPTKEN